MSTTGWTPQMPFEEGLAATVAWYRENQTWIERVRSGAYREWQEKNYGSRDAALSNLG
jgi:dTDP-glucose 4,6-dehydratase